VYVWLALVAYLALVKLALTVWFPAALSDPGQAAVFTWPALGIVSALGLLGAWLAGRTGFPAAWDRQIAPWRRLLLPALLGIGFALVHVLLNHMTGFAALQAARHGVVRQYTGFVPMLLVFTAALIIVEVVFRLFPVPLLLWLISNVGLGGRGQVPIFWALALISAALYVLSQLIDLVILPAPLMIVLFLAIFSENITQSALFRRYGLLTAIVMRIAFYLVWNVMYIH
jgi:hypothetical protein